MKIVVVGIGEVGHTAAKLFEKQEDFSEVILCDINETKLQEAIEELDSFRFSIRKIDAQQTDSLVEVFKGASVVFNFGYPHFNISIMEAALLAGANYVDVSLNDDIADLLIEEKELPFHKEFKEAGLTALITCGDSPGITNVITKHLCNKLDEVESVDYYLGFKHPGDSIESELRPYVPVYSPRLELEDFADPPLAFIDGEYKDLPLFANYQPHEFSEPVGKLNLSYHYHDEVATIPRMVGKKISKCTYSYPARPEVATIVMTGLAGTEPVDVKGVFVAPIDLVAAVAKTSLKDNIQANRKKSDDNASPLGFELAYEIHVKGNENGNPAKYTARWGMSTWVPTKELLMKNIETLGSAVPTLQVSALSGARLILAGETPSGVIAPESLDSAKFFSQMKKNGMPVKYRETVDRTMAME
ncbi:MAG: saccharopine dehydrogenase NADP-binding domain-containing protein [Spirochaetales bacterium]|nr:saccharopine dehydrogenase NADP-binding domain-containing protein [Spirochaetales bacterium]